MSNLPTTDPALLEALEKAKCHVMTPEEHAAQRRSFVRGMCPSHRDYSEWCEQVDKMLGIQDRADEIESLRAENAALKAKLAEREGELMVKEISSAPRDGTSILVFHNVHGWMTARFHSGEWNYHYERGREYDGPVWCFGDDVFQEEIEEYPNKTFHDGPVTHWRPLPTKPIRAALEAAEKVKS